MPYKLLKWYIYEYCYQLFIGLAEIITVFNSVIVRERSTITIMCEAIGYPPPTLKWSIINGTLSDRVSLSDNVSVPTGNGNVTRVSINLTITNAYRDDTGVYTCSAINTIGRDNSNVNITIQCKLFSIFVYAVIIVVIILANLYFQLLQKFFYN